MSPPDVSTDGLYFLRIFSKIESKLIRKVTPCSEVLGVEL